MPFSSSVQHTSKVQELPATNSSSSSSSSSSMVTAHGIYKRKYHLRAVFQSLAFVAMVGSYHVYDRFVFQTTSLSGTIQQQQQQQQQQPKQQSSVHSSKSETMVLTTHASTKQEQQHRRLSIVRPEREGDFGTPVAAATAAAAANGMLEWGQHELTSRNSKDQLNRHLQDNETEAEGDDAIEFIEEEESDICEELEVADPGWMTTFYSIGILYMFLAIAIVCDDFFVEALAVISDENHMNIDKDVAGATLMAAGGSAPELFTNLFGTFDESEIGFGTILGSAAFNVLLVIAACSIAAKELLSLTWWPLFRDCSYYALTLVVLAIFVGVISENEIEWWEALLLFSLYVGYVLIMWKNRALHKSLTGKELAPAELNDDTSSGDDESGNLEAVKAKFDAVNKDEAEGITDEQLRDLLTVISTERGDFDKEVAIASITAGQKGKLTTWEQFVDWYRTSVFCAKPAGEEDEDNENEPIYAPLYFPEDAGTFDKLWHLLKLPIICCLTFTVPDVRRPCMANWCYLAFLISICWIGFFAYFMVEWAEIIGNTIGVPHVVMGYTVLAAGTSVPDLISSVIVTRQGSGDMAISSSIGSNIFDITVGLPIPWLIFIAFPNRPNTVFVSTFLAPSIFHSGIVPASSTLWLTPLLHTFCCYCFLLGRLIRGKSGFPFLYF